MTMRGVIYARYSDDIQSPYSIEDQIRLCRERAASLGVEVVEVYSDAAISGAHLGSRPGMQSLMEDARTRGFNFLIAEALDRVSRDQEDIAGIYKRLTHLGVQIITLSEGEINELHIGLKGTMNALFLKDLAAKVRRGQRGRLENGRAPGGLTYGYRVVREYDSNGEPVRGKREIDSEAAAVVLRIFERYAAGQGPRQIAYDLNADNIPSPRGKTWNASSIIGSKARATGILNNELYIGRMTYDRQRFRKDPDTGKRVPTVTARAEWIYHEAPELRIVPQNLWDKAQALKRNIAQQPMSHRARPKHMLSGLMQCGCCGGSIIVVGSKGRIGCAAYRESRSCENKLTVPMDIIEAAVLEGIKTELLRPEAVDAFVTTYRSEWQQAQSATRAARNRAERGLREVQAKINRMVDAIADGGEHRALMSKLDELEAQRSRLASEIETLPDPTGAIALHPNLPDLYRSQVEALADCLDDPHAKIEAARILADLLDRITLHPTTAGYELEIVGRLAALMSASGHRSQSVRMSRGAMVAPDGFEPPIKRLQWPEYQRNIIALKTGRATHRTE